MLREELKQLSRVADAAPPCAPLAAVAEETPRGAAGSTGGMPRAAAVAAATGPAESGAGGAVDDMAAVVAAAAWGPSPDELDEESVDPMLALYLA